MSRTSPPIRKSGQRGWWIGSRRASDCVAFASRIPEAIRAQAAARDAGRYRDPAWTEIR